MEKQLDLFVGIQENTPPQEQVCKYSNPLYTPKHVGCNDLSLCFDESKYQAMLKRIDKLATISERERNFLKLAATRFVAFNYDCIADYYASASKEMQEAMESLALVLIDYNRAIELGFVKLNKNMSNLYEAATK